MNPERTMLHELLLTQLAARRGVGEPRPGCRDRRWESLYMKSFRDMRARAPKG